MMLHPSYSDSMSVVNSEVDPGETPIVNTGDRKPLSIAVEELQESKIKVIGDVE